MPNVSGCAKPRTAHGRLRTLRLGEHHDARVLARCGVGRGVDGEPQPLRGAGAHAVGRGRQERVGEPLLHRRHAVGMRVVARLARHVAHALPRERALQRLALRITQDGHSHAAVLPFNTASGRYLDLEALALAARELHRNGLRRAVSRSGEGQRRHAAHRVARPHGHLVRTQRTRHGARGPRHVDDLRDDLAPDEELERELVAGRMRRVRHARGAQHVAVSLAPFEHEVLELGLPRSLAQEREHLYLLDRLLRHERAGRPLPVVRALRPFSQSCVPCVHSARTPHSGWPSSYHKSR